MLSISLKHSLIHSRTQSAQTLAEAIEVAGLSEALSGGSFTIFAPTDNAFLEYFDAAKTTKEAFLVTTTLFLSLCLSFLLWKGPLFVTLTLSHQTHTLLQADKEKLANVLKYHVVEGVITGKALLTCGELKTLQGSMVKSVVDASERAFMNDEAKVETTDVEADNGVFHIIDYPLNPPKSA